MMYQLQDDYLDGCTDGTFKATGEKFFTCSHGQGLYFPLASLIPDQRFGGVTEQSDLSAECCKENRKYNVYLVF